MQTRCLITYSSSSTHSNSWTARCPWYSQPPKKSTAHASQTRWALQGSFPRSASPRTTRHTTSNATQVLHQHGLALCHTAVTIQCTGGIRDCSHSVATVAREQRSVVVVVVTDGCCRHTCDTPGEYQLNPNSPALGAVCILATQKQCATTSASSLWQTVLASAFCSSVWSRQGKHSSTLERHTLVLSCHSRLFSVTQKEKSLIG